MAKKVSLLDAARSLPSAPSSRGWLSLLTADQQREINELVAAKKVGEVRASYTALGELVKQRFTLEITAEHIAFKLGQMARGR